MELKEILKKMAGSYLIIYGCSMLSTYIFCLLFDPRATFDVPFFGTMAVFSFCGDATFLVFYARRELSKNQWKFRMILHFIILEAALLLFGGFLRLYENFFQGCVFAVIVGIVYLVVRITNFTNDVRIAREINEKLKSLKSGKKLY